VLIFWEQRTVRLLLSAVCFSSLAALPAIPARAADPVDVTVRPAERIAPGTVIEENACTGPTRLVLLARSRLGSGDVQDTPSLARKYAGMFHLAILAHVTSEKEGDSVRYGLAKVAVGLCLPIHGQNVVISSNSQQRLGANLSFVAKRILANSEKNLDQVMQIARHPVLTILDAKAIVLRDGKHRDMIVRHMIWVHPQRGKLGMLVWLLEKGAGQDYRMTQNRAQALHECFVEDRVVDVKSSEFLFGIPSDHAFAIVDIPQGTSIPVEPELGRLAASRTFTPSTLNRLANGMNRAITRERTRGGSR